MLVGLTTSAFGADQSGPTLEVIPHPREIKFTGAAFEPAAAKVISVSDSRADRFAARLLQEAMCETHGIDGNVFLLAQQTTNFHQLWLGLKDRAPDHPAWAPSAKNEGYGLAVNQDGVLVMAESEAGLFYGVQTLIQLLEQAHHDRASIAGMVIADWPTFAWRGRYFDADAAMPRSVESQNLLSE